MGEGWELSLVAKLRQQRRSTNELIETLPKQTSPPNDQLELPELAQSLDWLIEFPPQKVAAVHVSCPASHRTASPSGLLMFVHLQKNECLAF